MDEFNTSVDTPTPEPECGSHKTRNIVVTVVLITIVAAAAFWFLRMRGGETVIIPTLTLEPFEQKHADLTARLIGQQGGVAVHYFSAAEATAGFAALPDVHNLFDCPASIPSAIEVSVAHGDRKAFVDSRYWGYEYTGDEVQNQADGLTDLALFNGRFWLSDGERAITEAEYGYLNTQDADGSDMDMVASKRYYLMTSAPLAVSCIDTDSDELNDGRETELGTDINDADTDDDGISDSFEVTNDPILDPTNLDTDGDGVQDGTELGHQLPVPMIGGAGGTDTTIFIPDTDSTTTTDPTVADTDGGSLTDGEEDLNFNGAVDAGETDPNDPADDIPPAVCGDSVVESPEVCDDGGIIPDDGCSAECAVEPGWACTTNAAGVSECASTCGDGLLAQAVEACDDGNDILEDGCSATCEVEDPFYCTDTPGELSVCSLTPLPELQ